MRIDGDGEEYKYNEDDDEDDEMKDANGFDLNDVEMMVEDWKADNAEEMENLVIDGYSIDEDSGKWEAACHDRKACYLLTFDGGDVAINYLSDNQ